MKHLIKYFLSELLFFPRYLKKNGYVETWAYVYESDGRIGRLRYFSCLLTPVIVTFIVLIIMIMLYVGFIDTPISEGAQFLMGASYLIIISIIYLPFSFSIFYLTTRRLHDIGKSGWWQLIDFLGPIVIFLLIILLSKGDSSNNKFGPPPEKS